MNSFININELLIACNKENIECFAFITYYV